MKRLFSILVLAGLTMLTACGDEESDPQPVKTDLQLIQEGIIGYWDLESIEVQKDQEKIMYLGGCNEDSFPVWVQANVGDIDYEFKSGGKLTQYINCPPNQSVDDSFTYTITQEEDKFYVNIKNGRIFELITGAEDVDGISISAKCTNFLIQGATASTWKFKRK